MAVLSYYVYKRLSGKRKSFRALLAGAAAAETVMIFGYAVFAGLLYGSVSTALLSVPENIVQGVFGAAVSVTLYEVLRRHAPKLHML